MADTTRSLLEQALRLPEKERRALVRELRASFEDDDMDDDEIEVDPAFAAELERRAAQPPPPGGWPTGKEVLDEVRARLRERRSRGG